MRTVTIGGRTVGEGHPAFVIAEVGSNHNGDIGNALRLIDIAAGAGADAVKFQFYRAECLYSRRSPQFDYLKGESVYDLIKRIETPREWIPELAKRCSGKGIVFFAAPFDAEAVDLLDPHVPVFKVASFEAMDHDLLGHIASKGKPIIMSTGVSDLGEIEEALETIRARGVEDVVLLHCMSAYPAPVGSVNLRAMRTLEEAFKLPVGLSDHTEGVHIPVAAVAMGAKAIEKHVTLDRCMPGPDHPFAIEPEELRLMVRYVRDVESARGNGLIELDRIRDNEMYAKARRSIHARVLIPKGTRITEEMLVVKRPGLGILPKQKRLVVGRTARRDIQPDEWITWEMV